MPVFDMPQQSFSLLFANMVHDASFCIDLACICSAALHPGILLLGLIQAHHHPLLANADTTG